VILIKPLYTQPVNRLYNEPGLHTNVCSFMVDCVL